MTKTLLVDGDNLFKIGFHGVKDLFNESEHVGGIFHFINTLRKFLEEHNHDKVVVFWDAESNSSARKLLYAEYKANRRQSMMDFKYESYLQQKQRVKEYLEEVFVRQVEMFGNEADDLIAYYTQICKEEQVIIFSADKDLTQLISKKVTIYSPVQKRYYKYGDKIKMGSIDIPHQNVMVYKVLTGDKSDNIDGIKLFGEKSMMKFFPQMFDKPCTIDEIINNAREIEQKSKVKLISNLLTGTTKRGILGEEYFITNQKLVDLQQPLISDEGKQIVEQIYSDVFDPENRGYKNLMKMMVSDGLFKFLPKNDEAWVNFVKPFMKLIRKEKRKI